MERAGAKRSAMAGFRCATARNDMETEYSEAAEMECIRSHEIPKSPGTGRGSKEGARCFGGSSCIFAWVPIFFSGSLGP
jgi:hypothetical protein